MMKLLLGLVIVAILIPALGGTKAMGQEEEIPLIPREALFGNPDKSGVALSPDGSRISFLAPVDGVMNV